MSALLFLTVALQSAEAPALDRAVLEGVTAGVYPGAVLVVGTRDAILRSKGYGHLTWSAGSGVPRPDSTLYDLASLTKVVATTPSIMLLVARNRVRLDDPVDPIPGGLHGREEGTRQRPSPAGSHVGSAAGDGL